MYVIDYDIYVNIRKTRLPIDLNHREYIFLRTSSAQDSNSFSLICLQSMVMEKEAFSKTKIKGRPKNIRISAGRPQCINRPRFLTFLKEIAAPQVGVPYSLWHTALLR